MTSFYSKKIVYFATNLPGEALEKMDFHKLIVSNFSVPLGGIYACHNESPLKEFLRLLAKTRNIEFETFRDCRTAALTMDKDDCGVFFYNPNGESLSLDQMRRAMGDNEIKLLIIVADGLEKTEELVSVDTKKTEFLLEAEEKFQSHSPGTLPLLAISGGGERFVDLGRYNPGSVYH